MRKPDYKGIAVVPQLIPLHAAGLPGQGGQAQTSVGFR
jgi:hypothetical protein